MSRSMHQVLLLSRCSADGVSVDAGQWSPRANPEDRDTNAKCMTYLVFDLAASSCLNGME